tara:strand:+ start:29455 stop:30321 length:867 start_codon:yes stop_codon:yes gene_type:complete
MTSPTPTLKSEQAAQHKAEHTAILYAAAVCVGMVLVAYIVNALSLGSEIEWNHGSEPASLPWIQEGTAILAMLAGLPLAIWLGVRFPLEPGRWRTNLLIHCGGVLLYGLIQVNLMMTLRFAIWEGIYGHAYSYDGSAVEMFIYEFRKQASTYLGFQLIVAASLGIEQLKLEAAAAHSDARTSHRVTLRCGGRVMRLPAVEFTSARAAGNYVEVRFGNGQHLARTTLTDLEKLLTEAGIDARRVHRSWLINHACLAEITPTGEGDVTLTLADGQRVPGSRRYRDRLEAA